MNFDNEKKSIVSLGQINLERMMDKKEEINLDDLPILPTRNLVLFPDITIPISLGRENSLLTARLADERNITIGILCQSQPDIDNPELPGQFFDYGVFADVIKVIDLPDETHTAIIHARGKFKVLGKGAGNVLPEANVHAAVKPIKETGCRKNDEEFNALITQIKDTTFSIFSEYGGAPDDVMFNLRNTHDAETFINMVSTHLPIDPAEKMKLLAKSRIKDRAFQLLSDLSTARQLAEINKSIQLRTQTNITEQQRTNFLQHQMDAIKQELYGDDDDMEKFLERAKQVPFPEHALKVFTREAQKLMHLNRQSPDYSVLIDYLEMLLSLPWLKYDVENSDFGKAREILNNDHYGLDKVKERILEQIAVIMNNRDGKAPILCLVGAPGVGKTSLGQSVAHAMGRQYQRVSLGGLHDEAEIRGHRRTYVGAMPGRIMDAIKRAGTSNPVLMLDEIDKIGADFKGDPAAALLEVLDPEQNCHFHDNFIDIDYDLSKVMFIATANTLSTISQPLLDRMEIIDIAGYLLEEKVEIASRHLIPRLLADNKLTADDLSFEPSAIAYIIEHYTSESGVRQLEKQLAKVVRQTVLKRMSGEPAKTVINSADIESYIGIPRYNKDRYEGNDYAGVVTGLAWTAVGGEILYIETSLSEGKGEKLTLTGNLGQVMKESAMIAMEYVKSHAREYDIDPALFECYNVHIHVPEGAIPKDGPSAGITMVTSIVSAFKQRRVKARTAMTGEITLRGKVLPVGGIKEKILAAKRAGITDIILSADNIKDINDIAPQYREGLTFHHVDTIREVIDLAITDEPVRHPLSLSCSKDLTPKT